MFYGSHQTRVDEKGRLKMPAEYKRELEQQGREFFITSDDGKRAQLYSLPVWNKKMERMEEKMPASHPVLRRYMDVTGYYGQKVDMDPQGRLLLPQLLREDAKLTGDVLVKSAKSFLEIVNHDDFRAALLAAPITDADREIMAEFDV